MVGLKVTSDSWTKKAAKNIVDEIRSAYFEPVYFGAARIVSALVGRNSYRSVSSIDPKCDNYAIINFR